MGDLVALQGIEGYLVVTSQAVAAGEPTGAVKVYLDWIITSDEAQGIVKELGFVPIK